MPNQHNHTRRWKEEIAAKASELTLCVLLPNRLTANTRIRFVCQCGNMTETTVYRMVERSHCCRRTANASHPKESYARGALAAHKVGAHLWERTDEIKKRISSTLTEHHRSLKDTGQVSPSWGWKMKMGDPNRSDVLYLVVVVDTLGQLHYKIGRSFHGPRDRLQRSLVTVIATWEGPHWQVWWAERTLLDRCSWSRSSPTPTLDSAGGTECFSDLPVREVVKIADSLMALTAPSIG